MYQPKHRRFNANIGFFFENFSENGAKSGSGVIYTLIYQNENGIVLYARIKIFKYSYNKRSPQSRYRSALT